MRSLAVLFSVLGVVCLVEAAVAQPLATLKGRVLERGTKRPVQYAQIAIKGHDELFAETDERGFFTLSGIPAGKLTVVITAVGYEKLEVNENLAAGETVEVVYYIEPEVYGLGEIVVHGRKVRKEVSRQVVSKAELKAMPGGAGDPVRAIENLPGVGLFANSGGLVLRGSNREDSNIYLDGHIIPILFHFGGFKSVYNADLLEDIEVMVGSFGVEYAGAIGGIVNLRTRAARQDRWGGYFDTSLLDATVLAEGPLGGGRSAAVALRYSLIQYLIEGAVDYFPQDVKDRLSFSAYPSYWDYVVRYDHRFSRRDSFSVNVFGARDSMQVLMKTAASHDPSITGNMGFEAVFHKAIVSWRHKGRRSENLLSIGLGRATAEVFIGSKYSIESADLGFKILDHYTLRLGTHTLKIGGSFGVSQASVRAAFIRPPKEGDVYVSFSNEQEIKDTKLGSGEGILLFVEDTVRLGSVKLIPGINFRALFLASRLFYTNPRVAVRWKVGKPLVLKAAVGLYSQAPQLDELYPPWGNPDLDPEHAIQSAAGVEWQITEVIDLDFEAYYKYVFNLVVPDPETLYSNEGKGRIYGVEFLLRHRLTKRFFGWLAYSFCKSKRWDPELEGWRPFDEDVPHTITLVLSWKPFRTWQFGARLQAASGFPYTPIRGSVYNADNDTYIPIYDPKEKNSERTTVMWYQLDLRVDKLFVFDTWILSVYLDVQNVTLAERPLGVAYNYDFSQQQTVSMFPILPAFGIRAEF